MMQTESQPLILTVEARAARLDHFLASQLPDRSRARLQALVKAGHITLNDAPTRPGAKLFAGDRVCVVEPTVVPSEVLAQDIPLAVLHEDADLVVVNKPAGLVVHPAVGNRDGTLVNALLHRCPELSGVGGIERPGIVHRLDKETSGCLVVAKNDAAHHALAEQFAGREVTKIYLALAAGRFRFKSGEIDEPIGRHRANRQKMAVHERGKSARTGWRVLSELPCGTLVACLLHTGRTHQIRVHLKHLGHPVLGDAIYGKRAGFSRQMLHAWKLSFTHPRTGERLGFISPIPPDFREAGVPENP